MKSQNKWNRTVIASILALLFVFGAKSVDAQEVDNQREFDYIEGSPKGPEHWGDLKPEWVACRWGVMQSPIDLSYGELRYIFQPETRDYKPFIATLVNRGHDISLIWNGDVGSMYLNGVQYRLQQIHWHTPSEHAVNGSRYDMELHLVHQTSDGQIAVIGVLYEFGPPDKFLSQLKVSIKDMIKNEVNEVNLGKIDPNDIQADSPSYFRYMGSLTTPACSEGVIWTVNTKVKTVSRQQVKLLREAVHDYAQQNARPLQPQYGRDVYLYVPWRSSNMLSDH